MSNYYKVVFWLCIGALTGSNLTFNKRISFLESSLEELRIELLGIKDSLSIHSNKVKVLEEKTSELAGNVSVLDGSANIEFRRKSRIAKLKLFITAIISDEHLSTASNLEPIEIAEIATSIIDNCDKFNVPVSLMLGLIRQESAFNPLAESHKGAKGLTQVMDTTAEDISELLNFQGYNPNKISHNIKFGTYYLSRMLRKFHYNNQKAIWAYNTGPETVSRFINGEIDRLYKETIEYERKVQEYTSKYKSAGIY